jgi:membrane protease YdiL (CAAX protease family)
MCLSIILGWVFNNTGGSILSAVLLHFMTNFTITSLEGVDGRLSRVMGLTVTILHVLVVISILFYKKGMRKGYT